MIKKLVEKVFRKRTDALRFPDSVITLSVQFSFDASAQVGFRDADNRLRLKRFKARTWHTEFAQVLFADTPVELRTFIYTPHLKQAQQATLSISVNHELVKQQDFVVPVDADYAGWFELSYLP